MAYFLTEGVMPSPRKYNKSISRRPQDKKRKRNATFTRLARKIIYEALGARMPINRATELAGISPDVYRDWMDKGLSDPNKFPVHACFVRKIKRIQAQHEKDALDVIRAAHEGKFVIKETRVSTGTKGTTMTRTTKTVHPNWGAAAWFLERRYKDYQINQALEQNLLTPQQKALEIKMALDALTETVPSSPNGEE